MEKEKYLEDLSEIRSIMDRSSRFISLSGLSGVLAGFYALIGAYFAHRIIYGTETIPYTSIRSGIFSSEVISLIAIAVAVLILAVATGLLLTQQKAKKKAQTVWDAASKRMLINLAIPVVSGGILILILLDRELYFIISPLTLIFYGMGLLNASKYTLGDVKWLGIFEITTGLVCAYIPGYGLYFWAFGFGVLHILYGSIMYFKYER